MTSRHNKNHMPLFDKPEKSGRTTILDRYGELICKCESEYARDVIFELIIKHNYPTPLVGDIVTPRNQNEHLASHERIFDHAIVASLNPFTLTSPCAEHLWRDGIKPEQFKVTGRVSKETLKTCLQRLKYAQKKQCS